MSDEKAAHADREAHDGGPHDGGPHDGGTHDRGTGHGRGAAHEGGASHDAADPAELLMRAARTLRRRSADALAPWQLSPHHVRALRVVCARAGEGETRLSDVADALRIAPRSATEVIDALEARGLVERSPSARDRRAVVVRPTPEGARVREVVERHRAEQSASFLAALTPSERATLAELLGKVLRD
ncbi:MarR family winged helix-turn-helix transcriptional regulator [Georgenia sp. EYE_87]|uniref:MarR family winged helix-turn-helix transcriptional regulator n=1 Tax=Georgenia sp. EYE_87 TaxID=2853448 RepID=UPI002005437E|nr:MarR family winged helix-turn-helix transcriptional regulator [Georgenia sp. EYE_87]